MSSLPRPPNHLIGKRFGKLEILSLVHRRRESDNHYFYKAICKCDCGKEKEILIYSLVNRRTASCGCDKSRYIKTTGANSKQFTGYNDITGQMWSHMRGKAKERGIQFDISLEYVWDLYEKQNRKCALSGVDLSFSNKTKTTTASLDRIDNSKGYIEGNVQWVHKWINIMRNVLTCEEFIDWCKKVAKNNKTEE